MMIIFIILMFWINDGVGFKEANMSDNLISFDFVENDFVINQRNWINPSFEEWNSVIENNENYFAIAKKVWPNVRKEKLDFQSNNSCAHICMDCLQKNKWASQNFCSLISTFENESKEFLFIKRIISIIILLFDSADFSKEHLSLHLLAEISVENLHTLKSFANGDEVSLQKIDSIFTYLFKSRKSNFVESDSYFQIQLNKIFAQSQHIYYLVAVFFAFILTRILMQNNYQLKKVLLSGFVFIFITAFFWNWRYLYLSSESERNADLYKFNGDCQLQKLGLFDKIWKPIKTFFKGKGLDEKYCGAKNSPLDTLLMTLKQLSILSEIFGESIGYFLNGMFEKIGFFYIIPACGLLLSFVVLLLGYEFRGMYGMLTFKKSVQPSVNMQHTILPDKKLYIINQHFYSANKNVNSAIHRRHSLKELWYDCSGDP